MCHVNKLLPVLVPCQMNPVKMWKLFGQLSVVTLARMIVTLVSLHYVHVCVHAYVLSLCRYMYACFISAGGIH